VPEPVKPSGWLFDAEQPRKLRTILFIVLFLLAAAAALVSVLIVQQQSDLERVSRYNTTWVLSQAAQEVLRLQETSQAAALPGSTVDLDDVSLRVEVVKGRIGLLRDGEVGAFIRAHADLTATVDALAAALAEVEVLMTRLPDQATALRIRALLDPLTPRMLSMAASGNLWASDKVAADQRSLSLLHWLLEGLLFTFIFCSAIGVFLISRFYIAMVRALYEAKEAAEVANATKSNFLAHVSHELRTPLNAIIGFAEVIRDRLFGVDDRRYVEYAGYIHDSGGLLLSVINDLLDLSRIDAGHLDLNETDVPVKVLVSDSLALIGVLAGRRKVAINQAIEVDGMLRADRRHLSQVLINVLSNAVKFTPPGGRVELAATLDDDHALRITVADDGIGMSAEELRHVFEPFRRGNAMTRRETEGTGLGLPITKLLIERHGGTIEIESRLGAGTRVRITLPAARCRHLVPRTFATAR
jgi:signal transduction histidine kinase